MGSRLVALIAVLAVALAAAAVATAGNGGRALSATLSGAEEVPGPGDSAAGGQGALRLNQGQERICFRLSWADIDGTVTLAHIHPGVAGVANPPVVDLFTGASLPGTGSISGCAQDPDIDRGLIKAIRKSPSRFYLKIHSNEFPARAGRGHLGE